jgi:hypothetical protein
MSMRQWIQAGLIVALVVVCGCVVCGFAFYATFLRGESCSTPAKEPDVLRSYATEAVLSTPPDPAGAPGPPATSHYCDLVGVDHLRPGHDTAQSADFETTGRWPSTRLRARYDPVATAAGWTYVRQADDDHVHPETCFWVTIDGTRYCLGDGVEYCERVDGVVSLLDVSGVSHNDTPAPREYITVEIRAQWNATACPTK